MENVYFGPWRCKTDIGWNNFRLQGPSSPWLQLVGRKAYTSEHRMQRHLSVLFGVASFAETRHETWYIRLHLGRLKFETHLIVWSWVLQLRWSCSTIAEWHIRNRVHQGQVMNDQIWGRSGSPWASHHQKWPTFAYLRFFGSLLQGNDATYDKP